MMISRGKWNKLVEEHGPLPLRLLRISHEIVAVLSNLTLSTLNGFGDVYSYSRQWLPRQRFDFPENLDEKLRDCLKMCHSPLLIRAPTNLTGQRAPEREADHSPTSEEVKNTWIYTSTLPYTFMA
jgi:hypothetical protein